jgi:putative NADH-flavin reductase
MLTGMRLELYISVGPRTYQWTSVSPAALIEPGERTGKFRLGDDQLVTDAQGNSRISAEDFAIAIMDEVEHPAHVRH